MHAAGAVASFAVRTGCKGNEALQSLLQVVCSVEYAFARQPAADHAAAGGWGVVVTVGLAARVSPAQCITCSKQSLRMLKLVEVSNVSQPVLHNRPAASLSRVTALLLPAEQVPNCV